MWVGSRSPTSNPQSEIRNPQLHVHGTSLPLGVFFPRRCLPPRAARAHGVAARLLGAGAHRSQRPVRLAGVRARSEAARPPGDHRRGADARRRLPRDAARRNARRIREPVPRILMHEGVTAARAFAERCRAVFGAERFYVELQRNYVRGDRALTRSLMDVADAARLGVVASGNVHYHVRARHRLHDVLTAIRHHTTLDGSHGVRRPNSEFYLRPPAEVAELFADCPDAVANTLALAERCRAFDLTRDLGYGFPDFRGADRSPAPQALAELGRARLDERYPASSEQRDEAVRRLAEELTLIEHHRLSGFFLVYHDLFDLAREVAADVR